MNTYRFTPDHPGAVAYAYRDGPLLYSGDAVELTDDQRDRLIGIVGGADGGPCLVPMNPPNAEPEAVPAVPPAAESEKPNGSDPVKRARGKA